MSAPQTIAQLSKLAGLPAYYLRYKLARDSTLLSPYPLNITVSVNSYCDSACKTCNIWRSPRKQEEKKELSLEQWESVFTQFKGAPVWLTMTGGNQFLRKDFPDICEQALRHCRPLVMTMPVSGTLPEKIAHDVRRISAACRRYKTKLLINLSLDGVGEHHDAMRGKEGSFNSTLATYRELKSIEKDFPDVLTVGIYSVVSALNMDTMPQTISFVREELGCGEHNIEIAGLRAELGTTSMALVPGPASYSRLAQQHSDNPQGGTGSPISRLRRAVRSRYCTLVTEGLQQKKEIVPCFAGIASIYITAAGEVRACPVKDFVLGDLKKDSFRDIWDSREATSCRERIRQTGCYCTLANAYAANLLLNPGYMLRRHRKR